ncbi:MAG: DUF2336 domain-containing protein [Salinarimonas sp.]
MSPPPPPLDEDLARLSILAREGGAVAPVLMRVQADLFAASRRRSDAAGAFAELATRLLPQVDADVAAHVARRVAALPETPSIVLRMLAAGGGEAARLVAALAQISPSHVSPDDREPAEAPVALARARREDLDLTEVARLVARDEPAVDRALAENPDAPLQGRVLETLVSRARAHDRSPLARALLARPDLPVADAASLFAHADEPNRTRLLVRLAETPPANARPTSRPRPTPATVDALLAAADRGDRPAFGSAIAAALQLDTVPDWAFHEPTRHDLLALAARAAGLGEEETIRIFLTLDPAIARSVPIVFRLVGLTRGVPRSVSARIVEAVYGVSIGARHGGTARHVPVLGPEARQVQEGRQGRDPRQRSSFSELSLPGADVPRQSKGNAS